MTDEDWKEFIAFARHKFKTNKLLPTLEMADFVQECCIMAVKTPYTENKFTNKHHYMNSVIHFVTKTYYYSTNNVKNSKLKVWINQRSELLWDFSDEQPLNLMNQQTFGEDQILAKMDLKKRLPKRKKQIVDLYIAGYTYREIGDKMNLSGARVQQILSGIKL